MKANHILDKVAGDGGSASMTTEELEMLKAEMQQIKGDTESGIWSRRSWTEDVRFCRWDGQSDDGRKRQSAMGGKAPHPFEGATDGRIRLADMIIGEHVAVKLAAAMRADLTVKGMETTDESWAAKLRTLLRYITRGRRYWREIVKLTQYEEGDSPAAAILGVFWHHETGIRTASISAEEFVQLAWSMASDGDPDEEFAADLMDMVINPEREDEAMRAIQLTLPKIRPARVKKILKAWRSEESAEYPESYDKPGRIRYRAMRLFEDVYLPSNTGPLESARVVYVREWMSPAEIQEKIVTEGWSESFVNKVLKQSGTKYAYAGKTSFPETIVKLRADGSTETISVSTTDAYAGLIEIIYPYWKAVNDDGMRGVYWTIIHPDIDESAVDRQICPEAEVHGEYPFVEFSREILNDRLLDSRSISELCMTDQQALKLEHDAVGDHAQLSIPPIFVPANRPNIPLQIGPLRQIKRKRSNDYEWMHLPDFPSSALAQQKETRRRVDEYFGRYNPEVDERVVIAKQQFRVNMFLWSLADVMLMSGQLAQANMTDEEVSRIIGGKGVQVDRSRAEIQGQFDVLLDFDVRNLDPEYVLKLAESISKVILPMDNSMTIQRDKTVGILLSAFNPQLAEATLRPVEDATQDEINDEENNFVKISVGIEPPMVKEGQNHELRYMRLVELLEEAPDVVQSWPDRSKEILKRRLDHLEFMVQQEENKIIGTVGATPALGEVQEIEQ